MTLQLPKTASGKATDFKSLTESKVTLYTCGPTVYNYLHVGNWAAYIYWDTLVRTLLANDYQVERVMNITDVGHLVSDADEGEDKLEKGARLEGKTAWEVAEFYTADFLKGMQRLGLVTPQHVVRATDFVPQQLELVRKLQSKGYTYQIDDGIYFDTSKFPSYADFAGLDLESQKAGARVELNQAKRNPSDFALWKFTPVGQKRDMEWQTPPDLLEDNLATNDQVMGFPGWHLECSAMAMSILGSTIDIHTGGIDHIPVHHTNEVAQSQAASGQIFANYWLHNNHLQVDGSKISKSLGNGYTLDDLEDKGFTAMDFRMFTLQSHYRSQSNFTLDNLISAQNRLHNWRAGAVLRHQTHDRLVHDQKKPQDKQTVSLLAASQATVEALSDDLNTPEALRVVDQALSQLDDSQNLSNIYQLGLVQFLETIDSLLGLQLIDSTPDIDDESKALILERNRSRENKDWARADAIRDQLLAKGIVLRDVNGDSIWQYT